MSEKLFNRTVKQSGGYMIMQIASKATGLLSFPILTRTLSVHDYGILALMNTTLLFIIAVSKCGIPKELINNLGETEKTEHGSLYNLSFFLLLTVTFLVCFLFLILVLGINYFFYIPLTILMIIPIVVARNVYGLQEAWYRFKGEIVCRNLFTAIFEIGSAISIVIAIVLVSPDIITLFTAQIFYEVFVVVIAVYFFQRRVPFTKIILERSKIKNIVSFGLPLVWLEIAMIVMTFGDRYQIGLLLDARSVGLYTASYNVAQYGIQLISQPIILAVFPLFNKLYYEKGEMYAGKFFSKILDYYIYLTVPVLVFISSNAYEILSVMASDKYSAAARVIPIVLIGNILNGCLPIVSAGLYISKKTNIIGKVAVGGALFNFMSNWLFIYYLGYFGAAFSTMVTFIGVFFIIRMYASSYISINFSIKIILKSLVMSFAGVAPSFLYSLPSPIDLAVSAIVFLFIYLLLLMVVEKKVLVEFKRYFIKT